MLHGTNSRKKVPSWEVVGALVALYRKQAGLTQPQLATQACVALETLGSIEQGRRALRLGLAGELDESILEKPIGGREVLRGQILHLREMAELPFLALQIIPKSRTTHAGLDGPMVLLETPAHEHVAYIEGQRVSFLIDDPDEVGILQAKYGMLRSQALTPEDTMGLLERLAGVT
ncbi:helix-turn-helix domain-containing protein [Streptomyces gardneri]|uniref:helix-turn-helix domain-containing protein n=1 Tax=Streptomyces gardneri TaxID=66892 RepID=UPI0035D8BE55